MYLGMLLYPLHKIRGRRMSDRHFNVTLLPYQWLFMQCTAFMAWLKAGIGSGKSYVLAHWALWKCIENPRTMGMLCANSYRQLNDSILRQFFTVCQTYGIGYKYNQLLGTITMFNGAIIKTASLDSYDNLRGIEVGWLGVDEAPFASLEAINVVIGRVRCMKTDKREIRFVGSPNGFNWAYDMFAGSGRALGVELLSGSIFENHHLPSDYAENLKNIYDPLTYRQEVLGEFVAAQDGRVYYMFDRSKHLMRPDWVKHPNVQVWGGADFNVNPITGVKLLRLGNKAHLTNEIWIRHSNTFRLAEEMVNLGPYLGVVPDATGSHRKSSSSKTDHEILRDAGLPVISKRSNPPVKDRYNAVNKMFRDLELTVDPNCVNLARDFENFTYEKAHADLGHVSDAGTYPLWHLFPYNPRTTEPRVIDL